MSKMSQLHTLITEALQVGLSDENIIQLMIEEGLPAGAAPEVLKVFKHYEENEKEIK
jgi:hypothetical protein